LVRVFLFCRFVEIIAKMKLKITVLNGDDNSFRFNRDISSWLKEYNWLKIFGEANINKLYITCR
jgi:hypothetical protein